MPHDGNFIDLTSMDRSETSGRTVPIVIRNGLAAVQIAALFHDLGKATVLFQEMISKAIASGGKTGRRPKQSRPTPTMVRHELFSAVVWDQLFGALNDAALPRALCDLRPAAIDTACADAAAWLLSAGDPENRVLDFDFLRKEDSVICAIGLLILTHHRLPAGDTDHRTMRAKAHAAPMEKNACAKLKIAAGTPYWYEAWWQSALSEASGRLDPAAGVAGVDIPLRGALVFADHVGSSEKKASARKPAHIANTTTAPDGKIVAADSLSTHIRRVFEACEPAFALLHDLRGPLPGLTEGALPVDLVAPKAGDERFAWQAHAARAARDLAGAREGGFFGCLLAGTGTGKTRGAPAILAGATFGDVRAERRSFRMTLGLGLRVLASQSAKEYVSDLGLSENDVRVLIGTPPIAFEKDDRQEDRSGSASLEAIPSDLQIASPSGAAAMPAILEQFISISGKRAGKVASLAASPVIVATVDHLMSVAAPVKSAFLPAAIRVRTSDLILDEIDQYGGEDIAAIARLVFQTGAAGRRVLLMSATMTPDIGDALYQSYCAGWASYASAHGRPEHVNLLITGDAPGALVTNAEDETFQDLYEQCKDRALAALKKAPALRRGAVLDPCTSWSELVDQIDDSCSTLHDANGVNIDGFSVSVGLVRMTRISHTAALFQQLPAGALRGRLRVKLCLHSNFPRVHRAWVEERLKSALTRKGVDPHAGLRALCLEEGLFDRARAAGARDIEIVCVTSPVIETGNDLDFDYAILDPVSMRSIVQAAGRVRRHRPAPWEAANTVILGRSPIVMQGGKLAMPGVETETPPETCVPKGNLGAFSGRHFRDLVGENPLDTITAALILDDQGTCPLLLEEKKVVRRMLAIAPSAAGRPPLGHYLDSRAARMTQRFTRTRMFRRATAGVLQYAFSGESLAGGAWQIGLPERGRAPVWRLATDHGLHLSPPMADDGLLFQSILPRAWAALPEDIRRDPAQLGRLVAADVPFYGASDVLFPVISYAEQTGFTRNLPEDLFGPFGSAK